MNNCAKPLDEWPALYSFVLKYFCIKTFIIVFKHM